MFRAELVAEELPDGGAERVGSPPEEPGDGFLDGAGDEREGEKDVDLTPKATSKRTNPVMLKSPDPNADQVRAGRASGEAP